jgi:hypothetical protein
MATSPEDLPVKQVPDEADLSLAPNPAMLAWRSTWLDGRSYQAVDLDPEPLKRGFFALLVALAVAAVSRLIGIGLGLLTLPKVGIIQEQLYEAIVSTTYYMQLVQESPEFPAQFSAGYVALWDLIRLIGGYPSYAGLGSSLLSLLSVLGSWLSFASLSYLIARWLGAGTDYKRALGVFALAYTPIMLTAVEMIPGASVAGLLIFALVLVAKFLAAREVYELSPGASLAVIVLPYVLGLIIILALLLFGAALGLSQIPFVDEFLRTARAFGLLGG